MLLHLYAVTLQLSWKSRCWSQLRPRGEFPASPGGRADIYGTIGDGWMEKALQVQQILAARELTLNRVSERSAGIFGSSAAFYVPHNLYHRLARPSFQPTIHQILALSYISSYRLCDWLAVFGFDLDVISRVQLLIPRRRTTVLDSAVYDTFRWVPWFAERARNEPRLSIAPLGHFVLWDAPRRAGDLLPAVPDKFVYTRIGEEDVYARPQFVPGGIIRADRTRAEEFRQQETGVPESHFFLVEHRAGWTCSRLVRLARDRVLLHCPQHPCVERELRLERDARVLGVIDAEIRPVGHRRAEAWPGCSNPVSGEFGQYRSAPTSLRNLLVGARARAGMSFREASSLSRLIATTLSDPLYFAAPGSLSDYETLDAPPRHIQKILTICILYGIGFYEFLRTCGLPIDRAGRDPIPDHLMPRKPPHRNSGLPRAQTQSGQEPNGFLSSLLAEWQEVPLFLRFSLDAIAGMKSPTLSDVFWVAGDAGSDPLLKTGALVAVNRRAKRPGTFDPAAACAPPLYLLLKRDGEYACGRCSLDRDVLRMHAPAGSVPEARRLRNGIDAEIVGKVTAILRRLF